LPWSPSWGIFLRKIAAFSGKLDKITAVFIEKSRFYAVTRAGVRVFPNEDSIHQLGSGL
jgi:hypothetical protein